MVNDNTLYLILGIALLGLVGYWVYTTYISPTPKPTGTNGPTITVNPMTVTYTTHPIIGPTYSTSQFVISGSGFTPYGDVVILGGTDQQVGVSAGAAGGTFTFSIPLTGSIGGTGEATASSEYASFTATDEQTMVQSNVVNIAWLNTNPA